MSKKNLQNIKVQARYLYIHYHALLTGLTVYHGNVYVNCCCYLGCYHGNMCSCYHGYQYTLTATMDTCIHQLLPVAGEILVTAASPAYTTFRVRAEGACLWTQVYGLCVYTLPVIHHRVGVSVVGQE